MEVIRKYKKDWFIVRASILCAIVCPFIFWACSVLADATSLPVLIAIGATPEQIREGSNMAMLSSISWGTYILISLSIGILGFLMMSYLQSGFEDGIFTIPYQRDIYGNKIAETYIDHEWLR